MCQYSVFMENMKMRRKQDKKNDLPQWRFEPQIFEQVPVHNLNFEGHCISSIELTVIKKI